MARTIDNDPVGRTVLKGSVVFLTLSILSLLSILFLDIRSGSFTVWIVGLFTFPVIAIILSWGALLTSVIESIVSSGLRSILSFRFFIRAAYAYAITIIFYSLIKRIFLEGLVFVG